GNTLANGSYTLLKQYSLLLAITRNEQYMINPVHYFVLIESDILIVILH
ncbi:potassium channel protein, partial [Bacillus thuringiensis]|nr:potassium channel protein [Bacillus thuringiensis]